MRLTRPYKRRPVSGIGGVFERLHGATKSKKILMISGVAIVCSLLFTMSYLSVNSSPVENGPKSDVLSSQVIQLEECLEGNVSQVMELTVQITKLNKEISELKSIITQQNTENEKLKQQINNLDGVLTDVENQLKGLMQTEQIALLVERLRDPPVESIGVP